MAVRKDFLYEVHVVVREYQYFRFFLGFPSSEEVLGEIFDYGQYIIQPETLCRTEWYTDTILTLTAYIHGHSEQMPLPPNIACGTLSSITLVSIENSPVYIPTSPTKIHIARAPSAPIQGGSFRSVPFAENQLKFMSPNEHFSTQIIYIHLHIFLLDHRVWNKHFLNIHFVIFSIDNFCK